jgi:hypothetical protein
MRIAGHAVSFLPSSAVWLVHEVNVSFAHAPRKGRPRLVRKREGMTTSIIHVYRLSYLP